VAALALDTDAAVAFLVELAHAGPALELAIGTGRLALPLAERGVEVHGIDASEAMVARLRSKSGGERIPVTIGDFADVPIEGRYALVYVVFNTLFALQTQEAQIRCFRNVAACPTDGGVSSSRRSFPTSAASTAVNASKRSGSASTRSGSAPPATTRSSSGSNRNMSS
jgi:SAM-dependent methyltransferase